MIRKCFIYKVEGKTIGKKKDTVVEEISLTLYLNKKKVFIFHCSPANLKEMIFGFLFSQGFIKNEKEVKEIQFNENKVFVEVESIKRYSKKILEVKSSFQLKQIFKCMSLLSEKTIIFQKTGGTHAAMLCQGGNILYFYEDIGRYNAIDKVLGKSVLSHIRLDNKIIFTTGRVSQLLLEKVIYAGIPVLVSRGAVSNKAIYLARKYRITLLGFVRENRANVYSQPSRLL